MKRTCLVTILVFAAVSAHGCHGSNLTSRPKDRDIAIDGRLSEWKGVEFVEKKDLSLGLVNDDSFLYVAVIARDPMVRRQIMVSGLYLWFDENRGKNKNFGVCFPIGGVESADSVMGPQGSRWAQDSTVSDSLAGRPPAGPPKMVIREMMVYSAKRDGWAQTGKGSLGGVEAAAEAGRAALVLEYKIPLERDPESGYGIGVRAGQSVGVGVESPEIRGGDLGHRGGAGGGGDEMGGPGGRDRNQPPRPHAIKAWGTLTLTGGGVHV